MYNTAPTTDAWRTLLRSYLPTRKDRVRLAERARVDQNTLLRWMKGDTQQMTFANLERVLAALPLPQQTTILPLVQEAYPDFVFKPLLQPDGVDFIPPSVFYRTIHSALAHTAASLRFWTVAQHTFVHLLPSLERFGRGINLSIMQCLRPASGRLVRSLYEREGVGSGPWERLSGSGGFSLGRESLAGYAVMSGRAAAIQSLEAERYEVPVIWTPYEQSAAAFPLLRAGDIAGCLLISSVQPYFFSEQVQSLARCYADVLALAFEPDEFFALREVQHLSQLPPREVQTPLLATFTRRVEAERRTGFDHDVATLRVRQMIESELIAKGREDHAGAT